MSLANYMESMGVKYSLVTVRTLAALRNGNTQIWMLRLSTTLFNLERTHDPGAENDSDFREGNISSQGHTSIGICVIKATRISECNGTVE